MSALVSPPPDDKVEHVNLLLSLADDPTHVLTTMDGPTGLAFIVPDELATRYLAALYDKRKEAKAAESDDTDDADITDEASDDVDGESTDETPAPKRRGRPPGSKNKVTTDQGA